MKVVISGGSGFIGSHLTDALLQKGYEVAVIDRHPPKKEVNFYNVDLAKQEPPLEALRDADAVIHLAGKSIFGRWTDGLKKEIYDSRVLGAKNLASAIRKLPRRTSIFISASAVGYYSDKGEEPLDESSPAGDDFLAKVCVDWETATSEIGNLGIRVINVRTAPVLGRGGLLQLLLPIYKLGLGGPLGDGRQWFPWTHITDIVNIYTFALENQNISGPANAVSPGIVRYKEFSDALAHVLGRPAVLRVPKWTFRSLLGEFADSVYVSQKVYPKKLLDAGYKFSFPEIKKALEDILILASKEL